MIATISVILLLLVSAHLLLFSSKITKDNKYTKGILIMTIAYSIMFWSGLMIQDYLANKGIIKQSDLMKCAIATSVIMIVVNIYTTYRLLNKEIIHALLLYTLLSIVYMLIITFTISIFIMNNIWFFTRNVTSMMTMEGVGFELVVSGTITVIGYVITDILMIIIYKIREKRIEEIEDSIFDKLK